MKTTENYVSTVIREEHRTIDGTEYVYKLTARMKSVSTSLKIPLYSIEVTMKTVNDDSKSAVCADAFSDVGSAMIFFDKIVRCAATPIDLAYVYEDDFS